MDDQYFVIVSHLERIERRILRLEKSVAYAKGLFASAVMFGGIVGWAISTVFEYKNTISEQKIVQEHEVKKERGK